MFNKYFYLLGIRLVITRCVLDHTLPVTQLLQSKGGDIVAGLHLIQSLKNLFVAMRNEIDQYHDRWYKKVIELANKVDVIESKPRTCGRQVHRGNAPATSISEYYKRNITIPLIDHLNTELKNRFGAATTAAYSGLSIIPATLISSLNHSQF